MHKKASELRWEVQSKLKGGKGDINFLHVVEPSDLHGTARQWGLSVIPVGCSIGQHTHTGDFEVYYFLKGKGLLNDNGEVIEVGPGDMMMCNDGDYHALENIGDEDLEYIAVIAYSETHKE